jgi:hypothetical protein
VIRDEFPWVRGIDCRETAVFRRAAEPLIRSNEHGNTSDLSQSERNRQLDGVKSSKSSFECSGSGFRQGFSGLTKVADKN